MNHSLMPFSKQSLAMVFSLALLCSTLVRGEELNGVWESPSGRILAIEEREGNLELIYDQQLHSAQWVKRGQSFQFYPEYESPVRAKLQANGELALRWGWMGSERFQRTNKTLLPANKVSRGAKQLRRFPSISNYYPPAPSTVDAAQPSRSLQGSWSSKDFSKLILNATKKGRVIAEILNSKGEVETMRGLWIKRKNKWFLGLLGKSSRLEVRLVESGALEVRAGKSRYILKRD